MSSSSQGTDSQTSSQKSRETNNEEVDFSNTPISVAENAQKLSKTCHLSYALRRDTEPVSLDPFSLSVPNIQEKNQFPTDEVDVKNEEPNSNPSVLSSLSQAIYEFQATLHESVISTTLESSAASLALTLQCLLHTQEKDARSQHEDQQNVHSLLQTAQKEIEALTSQLKAEREKGTAELLQLSTSTPDASSHFTSSNPEQLMVDLAAATGHSKLLEEKLAHSNQVINQLRSLLSTVIQENTSLRSTLLTQDLNTVLRSSYDEEVQRHQKTQFDLQRLQLEIDHMTITQQQAWEQHEALVREQDLQLQQYRLLLEEASVLRGAVNGADDEEADRRFHLRVAEDSSALLPLESEAAHAVDYLEMTEALKRMNDQVIALTEERDASRTDLLEKEKQILCLKKDSQGLTFRNEVLSQQVVSLLFKVGQLERRCRFQSSTAESGDCSMESQVNKGSIEEDFHPPNWFQPLPPHFATKKGAEAACLTAKLWCDRVDRPSSAKSLTTRLSSKEEQPSGIKHSDGNRIVHSEESPFKSLLPPWNLQQLKTSQDGTFDSYTTLHESCTLQQKLSFFSLPSREIPSLRNLGFSASKQQASPVPPPTNQLTGVGLDSLSSHSTISVEGKSYAQPEAELVIPDDSTQKGCFSGELTGGSFSLESYSVNSIEELVKRNQELISQLYSVTQDFDEAKKRLGEVLQECPGTAVTKSTLEAKKMLPAHSAEESTELGAFVCSGTTGTFTSRLNENRQPFSRESSPLHTDEILSCEKGDPATDDSIIENEESAEIQRLIDISLANFQLENATTQDHKISASLLSVLAELEVQQQDRWHDQKDPVGGIAHGGMSSIVSALVDLCCTQAVQISQQAMTEVSSPDIASGDCAAFANAHQSVMERLLSDFRDTLTRICNVEGRTNRPDQNSVEHRQGPLFAFPDQQHSIVSVESLQRLLALLRSATQRDNVLHCILKQAKAKELSELGVEEAHEKSLPDRVALEQSTSESPKRSFIGPELELSAASLSILPGLLHCAVMPCSPVTPMSPLPQTTASARHGKRWRSPSFPQTCESEGGTGLKEQEAFPVKNAFPSAPLVASESGPSSQLAVLLHGSMEEMQDRLAIEFAAREQMGKELEAEKGEHLKLLDAMWKLELERDRAVAAKAELEADMSNRIPSDIHQQAVDKAANAEASLLAREMELKAALDALEEARRASEAINVERRAEALRVETNVAQLKAQIEQNHLELVVSAQKEDALRQEEQTLQDQCLVWQQQCAEQNSRAEALETQLRKLETRLHHAQLQFLSDDAVQEVLGAIFLEGGDRAADQESSGGYVTHERVNKYLIREMREEREKMKAQHAHSTLHIQRLEETIERLEGELNAARQQSQSAQAEILRQRALLSQSSDMMSGIAAASSLPPYFHGPSSDSQEVEHLRRELRLLDDRAKGALRREAELREQLQIMSRDPVSFAARKYGLTGYRSMEEQLEALHSRNVELEQRIGEVESIRESLSCELEAVKKELEACSGEKSTLENCCKEFEVQVSVLQSNLEEKERNLGEANETAAALEASIASLKEDWSSLTEKHTLLEGQCKELREDNVKVLLQFSSLQDHLRDAEKREKEALLRNTDLELALTRTKAQVYSLASSRATADEASGSSSLSQSRLRNHTVSVVQSFRDQEGLQ